MGYHTDIHHWSVLAQCRTTDPELFFPPDAAERREPDEVLQARSAALAICSQCSVKAECLGEALRLGETLGIWGGTTPEQRKEMLLTLQTHQRREKK